MAVKLPRQWTSGSSRRKGEIPLDISKLEPGASRRASSYSLARIAPDARLRCAVAPLVRLTNGLEAVREFYIIQPAVASWSPVRSKSGASVTFRLLRTDTACAKSWYVCSYLH